MHYDDATERREEASSSKSWNAERKDVAKIRTEAMRRGRKKSKHDAEAANFAWETVGNGQDFISDRAVIKFVDMIYQQPE